ncbi:MAG TPA: low molecular weight protein-tyrosine-phosphatase [Marmoricola sp.]|nr:low molecular weight protein-tyrosine-phosphatase [Marmoricola sp.]
MTDLPTPRHPGRYRIALVCLGNICRSAMADTVLTAALADAGLDDRVEVVSSGTGGWHVGDPMDRRAAATLTAHGYDASQHRAKQFEPSWHDEADVVLAMDATNHSDLRDLAPAPVDTGRLLMFRDFDPRATDEDRDVPDPYFGDDDGFQHVMGIVERTCAELVRRLAVVLA